jgi:asparagine synthase (glutamine-hydrolysing)
MCGIVGRANARQDSAVDGAALAAAKRLLVHRGPDGEGIYLRGAVGLGHRRLAVVDVAQGAQPMGTADGRLQVVFNGEIYNHAALRTELTARGARFHTTSDTEVLLHGYDAWGDDLPRRLRGMFAFALWDARARRLVMVRDRVGIKPLYWTRVGEDLLFASEVKALFAFPDVPRRFDDAQLPSYLALRYVPGPGTLFEGIRRLEPGCQLTFESGQVRVRRYWDIPVEAQEHRRGRVDEVEEADRLAELLRDTTRMHLMGEVPVGILLSGGVDSTAVGWAMKAAGASTLKSFAVGYDGEKESELGWARVAARALGTEHREVRVSAVDLRDELPSLVWHQDEPNADGACIPLMLLSRRAREEVTVVLSGEGADELYAGYGTYPRMLAVETARRALGPWASRAAAASSRLWRDGRARKYLRLLGRPLQAHYFGIGRGFGDELLTEAFGPRAVDALAARFEPFWARTRGADTLSRLLYNDTRVWLPDDLLAKADRMTMAAAVELRVPFLDHVVLEHAWSLPAAQKLRGMTGKWLLRRALQGKIPEAILRRPKRGFPVPLGNWLRTSLHDACRQRLLASDAVVRGVFGSRFLHRLLEEHRSGSADRTEELYALWVFEEWRRGFFSPDTTRPVRNVLRAPTVGSRPAPGSGPLRLGNQPSFL